MRDYARLDAPLTKAVAAPGGVDIVAYAFREGLLRHIALEEKIAEVNERPSARPAEAGKNARNRSRDRQGIWSVIYTFGAFGS